MSSKIRVYELAKILGVSNKELMGVLKQLEIEVSSHMSSIDTELGQKAEDFLKRSGAPVVSEAPASGQSLVVPLESTVAEVASLLRVTPGEAVKALVTAGMMIPANAKVDERALDALGKAFGVSLGWAAVAMNVLGLLDDNWTSQVISRWQDTPIPRRSPMDTALCILGLAAATDHPFTIV